MMRAFVAVEVSDVGVVESISRFQSQAGVGARPVGPDSLHFTLQFLGEIPAGAAEKVRQALGGVEFSSFAVDFRGVGAFPRPGRARVIWIGTGRDGGRELVALAEKVGAALAPLGFSSDRPFRPHVTVLRMRQAEDVGRRLEEYGSAEFGRQQVTGIKFKQSVLTPEGPAYSDLGEVVAAQ